MRKETGMNWQYEKGRIYSVDDNGELMAETTFVFKGNAEAVIDRTYVHPDLRGRGVAGTMLEAVAEYFRKNGLKASATCPYAKAWLIKNKERYPDILS